MSVIFESRIEFEVLEKCSLEEVVREAIERDEDTLYEAGPFVNFYGPRIVIIDALTRNMRCHILCNILSELAPKHLIILKENSDTYPEETRTLIGYNGKQLYYGANTYTETEMEQEG